MRDDALFAKACFTTEEALPRIAKWRAAGDRIVFTNGCFDLLHIGHVAYLMEAKGLGSRLVVGVNSDASVGRLKGTHRPIKDQDNRMAILSQLAVVDMTVLFDSDTPYDLIAAVQPDILVKGGDWPIEKIVGSDLVLARGGEVRSLDFIPGYSTTALEQKIKDEG